MKSKHLISLTISFCFIIMSFSGLMLYFGQKQWHAIETLHIIFGVVFFGFAIFHILNNWGSIKGYSKERTTKKWTKEIGITALVFSVFLIGGSLEVQPFKAMAHGGKQLFGGKKKRQDPNEKDNPKDLETIQLLLNNYEKSVNTVDTALAAKVWQTDDNVAIVNNVNSINGWENVVDSFYFKIKTDFSNLKLTIKNPVIHTKGNVGWVSFDSVFDGEKGGETVHWEGRETQVLEKSGKGATESWKIVQVHF